MSNPYAHRYSPIPDEAEQEKLLSASAALYLELLRKSLSNTIFDAEPNPEEDYAPRYVAAFARHYVQGRAVSMLPLARLENLQFCILDAIAREVPGDLIETGVWRGGATILMCGVLKALGITDLYNLGGRLLQGTSGTRCSTGSDPQRQRSRARIRSIPTRHAHVGQAAQWWTAERGGAACQRRERGTSGGCWSHERRWGAANDEQGTGGTHPLARRAGSGGCGAEVWCQTKDQRAVLPCSRNGQWALPQARRSLYRTTHGRRAGTLSRGALEAWRPKRRRTGRSARAGRGAEVDYGGAYDRAVNAGHAAGAQRCCGLLPGAFDRSDCQEFRASTHVAQELRSCP